MSSFLAPPTFCRHSADGGCECPQFEQEDDEQISSPLGLCALCEHESVRHSPKVVLTAQQAREIKSAGGKPREFCKAKKGGSPCDCPCYIASEDDKTCLVCSCRAGWHLYKEIDELQPGPLMTPPMSPPLHLAASPSYSQSSFGWPPQHASSTGSSVGAPSELSLQDATRTSWSSMGSGYPASPQHPLSLVQSSPQFVGAPHQSLQPLQTSPSFAPNGSMAPSQYSASLPSIVAARSPTAEAPSPLELNSPGPSIAGARPMSPVEHALDEEDEQDPALRTFARGPVRQRQSTGSSAGVDSRQDEKVAYYNRARGDSIDRLLVRSASAQSSASTSFSSPRTSLPAPSPPPQRSLPPPPATLPSAANPPPPPLQPVVNQRNHRPAPTPPTSAPVPPDIVLAQPAPSPAPSLNETSDAESLVDPSDAPNPSGSRRGTMHSSFISYNTNLAESGSTYPGGDDDYEEEVVETPAQPLRTRDEIELAGWREAARQAVEAGAAGRLPREERAAERLEFPLPPPPQGFRQTPSSSSRAPDFVQPFSHSSTAPLTQSVSPQAQHPFLQSTTEDPMSPARPQASVVTPAPFAMNRSASSRSYREEEIFREQRQGSMASVTSVTSHGTIRTIHVGQRDRQGSLVDEYGRGVPPSTLPSARPSLGPISATAPPPDAVWRDYRSKNLTLSISPPIDKGTWKPEQVFSFRLVLDPKVNRSSYDKLEVRLVGNSMVYGDISLVSGEPPDNHDFMIQRTTIFPAPSPSVREIGIAQTSFSWDMQLPREQTCDCSLQPYPLPPSYGHASFRVEYMIELLGKKETRFGRDKAEKLKIHFGVAAPPEAGPRLARTPTSSSGTSTANGITSNGITQGVDGLWRTITQQPQAIPRIGSSGGPPVSAIELAYQAALSPDASSLRLLWRFTLLLGHLSPAQQETIDQSVLQQITDAMTVAVFRKVTLTKSGRKKSRPHIMPIVRPTQKLVKEGGGMEVSGGGVLWRTEGYFELNKAEAQSLTTCSVAVRFHMRATVPISTGITQPIDIVAHELSLDPPEPLPVTSPLSTNAQQLPLGLPQSPALEDAYLDRQRSTSPTVFRLPASDTDGAQRSAHLPERRPSASSPPLGALGGRRISLAAYSDTSSSHQLHGHDRPESFDSRSSGAVSSVHPPPTRLAGSSASSHSVEQEPNGAIRPMSQQSEHFLEDDEEQDEQEPPPPFEDAVRGDLVDWVAAEQRYGGRD